MVDTVGKRRARRRGHRHGVYPVASGIPAEGPGAGSPVGARTPEPACEKGTHRALNEAGHAAWLLERAFVSMIEQEELSMPALGQIYAALREAEASVVAIEARLLGTLRRVVPRLAPLTRAPNAGKE